MTGKPRKIRKTTLRGKKITISHKVELRDNEGEACLGMCGSNAIELDTSISGVTALDTIIHEALHICLPDIDEDSVDETATSIALLLKRMGIEWKNT